MWNNIVEPGRPQMTIWRMRIACWIPKTHSECVGVNLDFKLSPCVQRPIVFFGNLTASELLVPTFRNFLSVPSS